VRGCFFGFFFVVVVDTAAAAFFVLSLNASAMACLNSSRVIDLAGAESDVAAVLDIIMVDKFEVFTLLSDMMRATVTTFEE
jgi:hypothetical protein